MACFPRGVRAHPTRLVCRARRNGNTSRTARFYQHAAGHLAGENLLDLGGQFAESDFRGQSRPGSGLPIGRQVLPQFAAGRHRAFGRIDPSQRDTRSKKGNTVSFKAPSLLPIRRPPRSRHDRASGRPSPRCRRPRYRPRPPTAPARAAFRWRRAHLARHDLGRAGQLHQIVAGRLAAGGDNAIAQLGQKRDR